MASTASPTISSSSTLWATPSKEWVIPAKPKPGRKPKKETTAAASADHETDAKGRRVQNRAAQRAFRERKQMQLADLQTRVQQYEQGEVERTVAIQSLAKRLKEENDTLKAENTSLKERIVQLEQERDNQGDTHKKRWHDMERSENAVAKRPKISLSHHPLPPVIRDTISYLSSPSSNDSTADSGDSYPPFSPISLNTSPVDHIPSTGPASPFGDLPTSQQTWRTSPFHSRVSPTQTLDCRFCAVTEGACVCAELVLQQVTTSMTSPLKMENVELSLLGSHTRLQDQLPTVTELSILDNLPPYQPPVPLRRRSTQTAPIDIDSSSIFPVWIPADTSPTCSGDPLNCEACAGDSFGRAFCETLSTMPRCETCPEPTNTVSPSHASSAAPEYPASLQQPGALERLPTHEAWRQLKSHPNVAFADLRLLAEVVARRSKCTGPTVEIVPPPGSITPERTTGAPDPFDMEDESQSVLLTDPHAQYREEQARRVESQEVVVKCGCQDLRQVPADGVRDALRLLDEPFGRST